MRDRVTAGGIAALLRDGPVNVSYLESCTSTNELLRELAERGAPDRTLLVASHQTAGRGRRGREFLSPPGTGVYFSLLLRPGFERPASVTATAAVAAANAVEAVSQARASIKWVNDVLVGGRKVCGILTEGAFTPDGRPAWQIVGVGFNVCPPDGGFPASIRDTAGAIFPAYPGADTVCRLVASFVNGFAPGADALDAYRARCITIGKRVTVPGPDGTYTAFAEGVDDEYRLVVRKQDGTRTALSSGEVSLHLS